MIPNTYARAGGETAAFRRRPPPERAKPAGLTIIAHGRLHDADRLGRTLESILRNRRPGASEIEFYRMVTSYLSVAIRKCGFLTGLRFPGVGRRWS